MTTNTFILLAIILVPCVMTLLYKSAKSRGRSGHWLWWGIHPIVGLVAFAVLLTRPRLDIKNADARSLRVRYYLWIDSKQDGPYEPAKIRSLIDSSQIAPTTMACPEDGTGDWLPLSSYPQIFEIPESTSPSAPKSPPVLSGITYGQGTAIICILVLIFFLPFFHSMRVLPPPQWDYEIVSIPDASLDSKLDDLGASGWELVFARRASDGREPPTFSYEVILKRPKNSSVTAEDKYTKQLDKDVRSMRESSEKLEEALHPKH